MNRKQRRQALKNSGTLHGKGSKTMTQCAFEAAIKWYQREALEGRFYPLGPEMEALIFPNGINPLVGTPVEAQAEDPLVDSQPPA